VIEQAAPSAGRSDRLGDDPTGPGAGLSSVGVLREDGDR
jgi:hypothetical protein